MGRIADLIDREKRKGPPCSVAAALAKYTPAERAEWVEALNDETLQHVQISRAFSADDVHMTSTTISRHRRRECLCGPDS